MLFKSQASRLLKGRQMIATSFPFRSWRQSKPRNSARPLFTVLAAALTGLFLVSSLAWILTMRYPAIPAAPRTVQSPPAIGSSNTSIPLLTSSRVTPRSGEIYTIVSSSSGKLLEVANGQWNGAGVALSSSIGCACQNWAFCSTNDPNYPDSFLYLQYGGASPGPQASKDYVLGVADSSPKYQMGLAQFVPALKQMRALLWRRLPRRTVPSVMGSRQSCPTRPKTPMWASPERQRLS